MLSELTLALMRFGLLIALWVFVFFIVGVLRGDLYGVRVSRRPTAGSLPKMPRRAARSSATGAATPVPKPPKGTPTTLVVTAGPFEGTSLPLRPEGTIIGRSPEAALVLDDDFVSGRHTRIFESGGVWYAEDLGSTNGTYLGDRKLLGPQEVLAGSVLRIGQTVLELQR